jgi:hypothetical protein
MAGKADGDSRASRKGVVSFRLDEATRGKLAELLAVSGESAGGYIRKVLARHLDGTDSRTLAEVEALGGYLAQLRAELGQLREEVLEGRRRQAEATQQLAREVARVGELLANFLSNVERL